MYDDIVYSKDNFQKWSFIHEKTLYLKDDIEYSKDDFYKLSLYFIEDVEINDDIVQYEDGHSIVQYSIV